MNEAVIQKPSILRALLVPLIFLAVTLPTLHPREFTNGSENLNVATALEIRRTGNWLIPTLAGEPRIAKPPLAAWITASFLRASTLEMLDSPVAEVREHGYKRLAFETRFPAVLASAFILVAAYILGAHTGGDRRGMLLAIILASSYGIMRLGRISATDVHLSLWVSFAVVAIIQSLSAKASAKMGLLVGAFVGLAFMSKGPVALVQTLVPAAVACFWLYKSDPAFSPPKFRWWIGLLLAFALIGFPWFAYVLLKNGLQGTLHLWWVETSREGATDLPGNNPFEYLVLFPLLLPWMVFFVGGFIMMLLPDIRKDPLVKIAFAMLVVPVLIMVCFKDRQERYLQPMLISGALLAALAFERWENEKNRNRALALHIAILFGVGVAFPVVAAFNKIPDIPVDRGLAIASALVSLAIIFWISRLWRENSRLIPFSSWAIMIIAQNIYITGYAQTDRSLYRPFAETFRVQNAHASPWCYKSGESRGPNDFAIYLNRTVRVARNTDEIPPDATCLLLIWKVKDAPPFVASRWNEIDQCNDEKRNYELFVNRKPQIP